MRWPFGHWFRTEHRSPDAATLAPVVPARPQGEWAGLAPIARVTGDLPLTAPTAPFQAEVRARESATLALAPLDHVVNRLAEPGLVSGLGLAASEIGPAGPADLALRPPMPGRVATVQRALGRDERPPGVEAIAAAADPVELVPVHAMAPDAPLLRVGPAQRESLAPAGTFDVRATQAFPIAQRDVDAAMPSAHTMSVLEQVGPATQPTSIEPQTSQHVQRLTVGQGRRLGLGAPLAGPRLPVQREPAAQDPAPIMRTSRAELHAPDRAEPPTVSAPMETVVARAPEPAAGASIAAAPIAAAPIAAAREPLVLVPLQRTFAGEAAVPVEPARPDMVPADRSLRAHRDSQHERSNSRAPQVEAPESLPFAVERLAAFDMPGSMPRDRAIHVAGSEPDRPQPLTLAATPGPDLTAQGPAAVQRKVISADPTREPEIAARPLVGTVHRRLLSTIQPTPITVARTGDDDAPPTEARPAATAMLRTQPTVPAASSAWVATNIPTTAPGEAAMTAAPALTTTQRSMTTAAPQRAATGGLPFAAPPVQRSVPTMWEPEPAEPLVPPPDRTASVSSSEAATVTVQTFAGSTGAGASALDQAAAFEWASPTIQRATARGSGITGDPEEELDDLAAKLYGRFRNRLATELLLDRERAGLLMDAR